MSEWAEDVERYDGDLLRDATGQWVFFSDAECRIAELEVENKRLRELADWLYENSGYEADFTYEEYQDKLNKTLPEGGRS